MENAVVTVNTEEIMREIRQKQMEEDAKNLPTFESISIRRTADNVEDLAYVNLYYEIPYHHDLGSNKIVTFIKRVIRKIVKCAVWPIMNAQNQYNAHVTQCLNYNNECVRALVEQNSRLTTEVAQLKSAYEMQESLLKKLMEQESA